jgi:hypothetical protein
MNYNHFKLFFSKPIKIKIMKIYLSFVFAMIMVAGAGIAQNMNLGVKAGLNLYNVSSDPDSESDSKVGFHIGLLSHFHLAEQVGLQVEAVYSAQGTKETAGGVEVKTNLNYINVPVLFQYMFNNGFRIQAGPQLGILISANAEGNGVDLDIKDDLETIELGLSFGVSYVHVPSGFGVDARYNLGLSDLTKSDLNKVTNNGLQIGVFYLFMHHD